MRFKTRLQIDKIPHLLRIVQVLEKLDRTCVLHLHAPDLDSVRIIVQGDVSGSVASYVIFKRTQWFESYRIESQNANQIGLQLDIQNLTRALRSAAAADDILIKLSKKGVPMLTFEIRTQLGPILQDIPVVVLSAVRLAEYGEPQHDHIKGFTLPPLFKLHTVVDRMKALSSQLQLRATFDQHNAQLSLKVLTDNVSVSTFYNQLALASYDAGESHEQSPNTSDEQSPSSLEAVVDLKNFSKSLCGYLVQPTHAICFIHPTCVMIHLIVPFDVTISYYVPRRIVI